MVILACEPPCTMQNGEKNGGETLLIPIVDMIPITVHHGLYTMKVPMMDDDSTIVN